MDKIEELIALCLPIADWLKNQDPYMEVRITSERIEKIRIEAGIPAKKDG